MFEHLQKLRVIQIKLSNLSPDVKLLKKPIGVYFLASLATKLLTSKPNIVFYINKFLVLFDFSEFLFLYLLNLNYVYNRKKE